MSTQAFTQMIQLNSAVVAEREAVKVGRDAFFGGVLLPDFLERLALKVGTASTRVRRPWVPPRWGWGWAVGGRWRRRTLAAAPAWRRRLQPAPGGQACIHEPQGLHE